MCVWCVSPLFWSNHGQLIKLHLLRNFDHFFKIRYFKRSNSDWCFNGMIYHLTYTPTTMHYSIINKKIVEVYFLLFSFNIIELALNELRNKHFLYPRLFTLNQLLYYICVVIVIIIRWRRPIWHPIRVLYCTTDWFIVVEATTPTHPLSMLTAQRICSVIEDKSFCFAVNPRAKEAEHYAKNWDRITLHCIAYCNRKPLL